MRWDQRIHLSFSVFIFHLLVLSFFNLKFSNFCCYFWLHWVFIAAFGVSLVVLAEAPLWLQCTGFSLWWLLWLWSTDSWCVGSGVTCTGLAAPQHVGSSGIRGHTHVPSTDRWIFNHWTTREGPSTELWVCRSFPNSYIGGQVWAADVLEAGQK